MFLMFYAVSIRLVSVWVQTENDSDSKGSSLPEILNKNKDRFTGPCFFFVKFFLFITVSFLVICGVKVAFDFR